MMVGLSLQALKPANADSSAPRSLASLDPGHVPAETLEPLAHVLAKSKVSVAFDRDVIVVVEPAQVVELEVAGERSRFAGDAFHQVAITAQRIDVVVKQLVIRCVVVLGQPLLGHCHADGIADAGAERTGRGLDTGGFVKLGVTGTDTADLTKVLDCFERDRQFVRRLPRVVHCLDARQDAARCRATSRRVRTKAQSDRVPARSAEPDRSSSSG